MKSTTLFIIVFSFYLAACSSAQAQRHPAPASQTPKDLCRCAGDESVSRGGIRTFEEFNAKFGKHFKSPAEAKLAWQVYKAVNQCDAVMIIGRLADTGSF